VDDREALLEMRLGDVVDVALGEILEPERLGDRGRPLAGGGLLLGSGGRARREGEREDDRPGASGTRSADFAFSPMRRAGSSHRSRAAREGGSAPDAE
jgi:hypothetical protein